MLRAALVVALAAATAGCRVTVRSPERSQPSPCPGIALAADEVRGDVNATFLRAVLTKDGAPLPGVTVDFRAYPAKDTFVAIDDGPTDATGAVLGDLGAVVLTDPHVARAVAEGKPVHASYTAGHPSGGSCTVEAPIAFAPARRVAVPPDVGVRDRAGFVRRVREVRAAIDADKGVPRLRDGTSACRMLYGLWKVAEAHPDWTEDGAADVERLRDAAGLCTRSPMLAGTMISLTVPFDPAGTLEP